MVLADAPHSVLVFPDDDDYGDIFTVPIEPEGPRLWRRIGPARGWVQIPADVEIIWDVSLANAADPSFIAGFRPKEIDEVRIRNGLLHPNTINVVAQCIQPRRLFLEDLRIAPPSWVEFAAARKRGHVPPALDEAIRGEVCREVGESDLAMLEWMRDAQRLEFHGLALTDGQPTFIERFVGLRSLELTHMAIGVATLERIARLRQLTHLGLAETPTDTHALQTIAHLRLTYLDLEGTLVDDGSVDILERMETLEFINVHGARLSARATRLLQSALPDVRIER